MECLCLGTIGLIVAPWKFDDYKTSIFALEASLLEQIFVLFLADVQKLFRKTSSASFDISFVRFENWSHHKPFTK